jgi:glucokinase
MDAEGFPRLLGDVGGTNVRLAWQEAPGGPLQRAASLACADFDSLLTAMRHYLAGQGGLRPRWCAFGIANPVVGDRVRMTNRDWSFSVSELQQALGLERLLVINDFVALALSLPSLDSSQLRQVGGGVPAGSAPRALIGPGTGLGVSGLLPGASGSLVPINGEGGHVTLAAADDYEAAVIASLRRRFSHVSAERAISGQGLENLYAAVCEVEGVGAQPLAAPDVTRLDSDARDPQCVRAVDLFFSFLGSVAGNLALTLGARGGVYVGGGIVGRLGDRIDRSGFRSRFEGKGRFSQYLSEIPTWALVTTGLSPALIGASLALDMPLFDP